MTEVPSPSATLAEETVDRLIKAGLLRADKRQALIGKISSGSMSGADWRLEIDLAQEKEARK